MSVSHVEDYPVDIDPESLDSGASETQYESAKLYGTAKNDEVEWS